MGAPTGNWLYDSARELTEMASMQFAAYGLWNPYTYQRPKITPLPNVTGLTVPGGSNTSGMEGGLNSERIEYYLGKARNNIDSDAVVLGSTGKYDIIAETEGYTYFKMSDDVWTSLEKESGGN